MSDLIKPNWDKYTQTHICGCKIRHTIEPCNHKSTFIIDSKNGAWRLVDRCPECKKKLVAEDMKEHKGIIGEESASLVSMIEIKKPSKKGSKKNSR